MFCWCSQRKKISEREREKKWKQNLVHSFNELLQVKQLLKSGGLFLFSIVFFFFVHIFKWYVTGICVTGNDCFCAVDSCTQDFICTWRIYHLTGLNNINMSWIDQFYKSENTFFFFDRLRNNHLKKKCLFFPALTYIDCVYCWCHQRDKVVWRMYCFPFWNVKKKNHNEWGEGFLRGGIMDNF